MLGLREDQATAALRFLCLHTQQSGSGAGPGLTHPAAHWAPLCRVLLSPCLLQNPQALQTGASWPVDITLI